MAVVIVSADQSVMVVETQVGLTVEGSPILATTSFSGIKSEATDQDFYDVATALFSLVADPLVSIRRDNRLDMTE